MAFLRMRRKVLRPVVTTEHSNRPVEKLEYVTVNGKTFTTDRARREYERRKSISDAGHRGFEGDDPSTHHGTSISRHHGGYRENLGKVRSTRKWEWNPSN